MKLPAANSGYKKLDNPKYADPNQVKNPEHVDP